MTVRRLAEMCWALGLDAPGTFARGLQEARLLLEHTTLTIDLRTLLQDRKEKSHVLAPWARNMLNYQPDGIVEIEPAAVRHLAISLDYTHREIADHLALFTPEHENSRKETAPTT